MGLGVVVEASSGTGVALMSGTWSRVLIVSHLSACKRQRQVRDRAGRLLSRTTQSVHDECRRSEMPVAFAPRPFDVRRCRGAPRPQPRRMWLLLRIRSGDPRVKQWRAVISMALQARCRRLRVLAGADDRNIGFEIPREARGQVTSTSKASEFSRN
jgi:NMD protein affecting ribosome stability and mRNA decay